MLAENARQPMLGPVVGIGASAGGLEAMMRLLPRLIADGRTCYLVAQHMAKNSHSELLTRALAGESALPVVEAKDGEALEPDLVYLIPPNCNGVLCDGRIRLLPPPEQFSTPSVNALFTSIAKQAGRHAIGIILSGAGSDGLVGCRAIKAHGGRVLVQTPSTAHSVGMPNAVLQAQLADEVLPPEAIAGRIDAAPNAAPPPPPPALTDPSSRSHALHHLLQGVLHATRIDFSHYKEETLLRRLDRRMSLLRIHTLEDYLEHTRRNPSELARLQQLFMVSLSWFFRDHSAFEKLRAHMALRLAAKPVGEAVRVWAPGCASGEECYSLAILLAELLGERREQTRIEIIGSDLNPEALDTARNADYKTAAFKETSAERLARHFVETPHPAGEAEARRSLHKIYRVADDIRALCRFREEDVIATEAPPDLDLISCRNLLIYMKSALQDQIIAKFHCALRPEGVLFLGLSENIGRPGLARFAALDPSLRIYRRKPPMATMRMNHTPNSPLS